MAKKQPAIRWRQRDLDELQRVANNFNAKLRRIKKKNPEMAEYLPDRVTKKDLISSIHTRADYKREIESLMRFSERGAETPVKTSRGAKATQWEVDEFKRKERLVNIRKSKELKKIEQSDVTSRGKKTGSKRSEMGKIKEVSLKPRDTEFKHQSQKEWEIAKDNINSLLDESWRIFRKANMKLNYIKGLETAGFNDVASIVREMDVDNVIRIIETDTEASFDFIYDPIEWDMKNDALLETWGRAKQDVDLLSAKIRRAKGL